jgi:hypothetical protein
MSVIFPVAWQDLIILLTYRCNLFCGNCIAGCGKFPCGDKGDIDLLQIERLFQQADACGWKWRRIWVSGGEPTLHPQVLEIIKLLRGYQASRKFQMMMVTNGTNLGIQQAILAQGGWYFCNPDGSHMWQLEKDFIINTQKTTAGIMAHKTMYIAPMDVPALAGRDFSVGCGILTECAPTFNKYGLYACPGAPTIDRIIGMDIGIKNFQGFITNESQLQQVCKYCGEYKFYSGLPFSDSREWLLSPTWVELKKKYDAAPPTLTPF